MSIVSTWYGWNHVAAGLWMDRINSLYIYCQLSTVKLIWHNFELHAIHIPCQKLNVQMPCFWKDNNNHSETGEKMKLKVCVYSLFAFETKNNHFFNLIIYIKCETQCNATQHNFICMKIHWWKSRHRYHYRHKFKHWQIHFKHVSLSWPYFWSVQSQSQPNAFNKTIATTLHIHLNVHMHEFP